MWKQTGSLGWSKVVEMSPRGWKWGAVGIVEEQGASSESGVWWLAHTCCGLNSSLCKDLNWDLV